MKAQPKIKIVMKNIHDYSHEIKLFKIAAQMEKEKLPPIFIVNAIKTGLEFEGVANLLFLWSKENDPKEKQEIISDIQDMIETCQKKNPTKEITIKFNDLATIAKNIRAFKDSLYQKVMSSGGISQLAESTGIPQPSLSRFFNSNAMPRRSTVLKIAKALDLNTLKIDVLWHE